MGVTEWQRDEDGCLGWVEGFRPPATATAAAYSDMASLAPIPSADGPSGDAARPAGDAAAPPSQVLRLHLAAEGPLG
jgi:hypothetical protein